MERTEQLNAFSPDWIDEVNRLFSASIGPDDRFVRVDLALAGRPTEVTGLMSLASGGWAFQPGFVGPTDPANVATSIRIESDVPTAARRLFGTSDARLACHATGTMQIVGSFPAFQAIDLFVHRKHARRLYGRVRALTVELEDGPERHSATAIFDADQGRPVVDGKGSMSETVVALEEGCRHGRSGGAQLFVAVDNDRYEICAGMARPDELMSNEHKVILLCTSKPLVAIALGQLWERECLDMYEPVSNRLDYMKGGGKERISPFDLLTHTAPLADPLAGCFLAGEHAIRRRIAAASLPDGPPNPVNYAFIWSWFVLRDLIQDIVGVPANEYLISEVLRPAGASGIDLVSPATYPDSYAPTYIVSDHGAERWFLFNDLMSSSQSLPGMHARGMMRDIGRIFEALGASESPLLRAPTLAAMTARHRVGVSEPGVALAEWGLGFELEASHLGERSIAFGRHCSSRTFGNRGYRSSLVFRDPRWDLVVAVHFNGLVPYRENRDRLLNVSSAIYRDLGLVQG